MDLDQGKLFIGGISWETTEEKLKEYFGKYGQVAHVVIMRDKLTGKPRGFGFVAFDNPSDLDAVLQEKHTIDGRTVEAKRAMSREEQQNTTRSGNVNIGKTTGGGGGGGIRTKKIFVGGLPQTLTEEGFRQYFQTYGNVIDVVVMYDQATQRPRGFGFISFDTEDAVDRVLHKTFHDLDGKLVEVKRALPKDANPNSGGARSTGGGSYQSYGGSGANTNAYDGNRYVQPPASGGNYLPFGSSGFGASGYGYGSATNGASYGGYGVGGYGSGPTGAYGNPAAPAAGYGSVPPGAPRSPWNNQAPASYGSGAYGVNTGYGAPATWNPSTGGGGGSASTGHSPGGITAYGNQSYGYGGYGATDGSYGSQSGYGAVGVRGAAPAGGAADQGAGSGSYMGGGYGDASGNAAYSNAWRSDPSQGGGAYGDGQVNGPPGGSAGYAGAYGSASRQAQH